MTDCESRIQAFSVALREESFQQNVTQRGRDTLEAVIVEILPKSRTATPAGCESMLARLANVTQSMARINEVREPATTRLVGLTRALNPVPPSGSSNGGGSYPAPSPGGPSSPGAALPKASSGLGTMTWILLGAAAVFFFLLKRRNR